MTYHRIGLGGRKTVLTIAIRTASANREKKLPMNNAKSTWSHPEYNVSVVKETKDDINDCLESFVLPSDHILTPTGAGGDMILINRNPV